VRLQIELRDHLLCRHWFSYGVPRFPSLPSMARVARPWPSRVG
jgi:hypothetical protein